MTKFLHDFKVRRIVVLLTVGLEILFLALFMFFGNESANMFADFSDWWLEESEKIGHGFTIGASAVAIVVAGASIGLELSKLKKYNLYVAIANVTMNLILLIIAAINPRYVIGYLIFSILFAIILIGYLVAFYFANKSAKDNIYYESAVSGSKKMKAEPTEGIIVSAEEKKAFIPTIAILIASLIGTFLVFVLPVCTINGETLFRLIGGFNSENIKLSIIQLSSLLAFFVMYMIDIIIAAKAFVFRKSNMQKFYKCARGSVIFSFVITILFFVLAFVMEFVAQFLISESVKSSSAGAAFVPLILVGLTVIANAVFSSMSVKEEDIKNKTRERMINRTIALGFTLAFLGLLFASLFSDIITINYESAFTIRKIKINGFDVLSNYAKIGRADYQALGFGIYSVLAFSIAALCTNVAMFFRKSKFFFKTSFLTVLTSFMVIVCLSLFGKYYQIVENMNVKTLEDILKYYNYSVDIEYTSTVRSYTIVFAGIGLAMLVALIILRPYTKNIKDEGLNINIKDAEELGEALANGNGGGAGGSPLSREDVSDAKSKDFDACPAFSEIDAEEYDLIVEAKSREEKAYNNVTLPSLVRFIVEYAKESRLHLSYKEEDIAQFIAGLGSSKLSILQGMSGTGKTSLPKIFTEAIFGNVNIIEVESSWKDKNELIGYYNEFSGKFTPKKFTQALYRAQFTPDVITFIVLDEMNLSRVEYYFSDFLSLMENEEDKREIKLLNVQLKNLRGGVNMSYKLLNKGHTLKIAPNVWFIGTANRDESTFEISDKVYDRAMTMNFMKRAPKIKAFNEPIDNRFLSYTAFKGLIDKALNSFRFDASTDQTIKEVERLLAPYNISFGNRIEKQIETFVSIYCSCFTQPEKMINEAVEKILFSKVVAKLEFKSVENKEELAHSFEELGLLECASFINKLNEDI